MIPLVFHSIMVSIGSQHAKRSSTIYQHGAKPGSFLKLTLNSTMFQSTNSEVLCTFVGQA